MSSVSALSTSALQAAFGIATRDDPRLALAAPASAPAPLQVPADRVTLSSDARAASARNDPRRDTGGDPQGGGRRLTPEQQEQVRQLQARDAHVRAHEAAHQAAGGSLAGGASYSFQDGPDGRSYAVGGDVPIRLAAGRTPAETIENARQVRAAALAPSDPSSADRAVAAEASQMEEQAESESRQQPTGDARRASEAYARAATA